MRAIRAEFAKLKGSRAPLWTALVVVVMVALGLIGAVAFGKPETIDALKKAGGAFAQAASAGLYTPNWKNMLRLGPQAIAGSWGVLVFSFVTAYVFGREFKEGTDSAMLTTPVRRETVVLAKMIVLAAWVFGLAALSFIASVTGFAILGLDGFSWSVLVGSLADTAEV